MRRRPKQFKQPVRARISVRISPSRLFLCMASASTTLALATVLAVGHAFKRRRLFLTALALLAKMQRPARQKNGEGCTGLL